MICPVDGTETTEATCPTCGNLLPELPKIVIPPAKDPGPKPLLWTPKGTK